MQLNNQQLLDEVINRNASDLHLVNGYSPWIRVSGNLIHLTLYPKLTHQDIFNTFISYTSKEQQEALALNKELDFGIYYNNYRFRVNAYYQQNSLALSLRLISNKIASLADLNLPESLHKLSQFKQGFVLITGQTSQGKSTTLASIINEINLTRAEHIITIEDPIEYIYPLSKALISQREIKKDSLSFHNSLRSVLREDPNIVVIGEMRDYETISSALTLAETGHLVFSTLHTTNASQTIDRIIDVFPEEQQPQIKTQLSNVLKAIISQRLLPTIETGKQIPALEILFNNTAVSSLIREGKTYQLDNVMQTSADDNMIIFEQYLKNLINTGKILEETALKFSMRPKLMKEILK
jgi:twitching motility protein PilT